MKVNELIEKLQEVKEMGYGNYDVYARDTDVMFKPNGEIHVCLCEHVIDLIGDLL